ncbi:MAG: AAA family ATPase [Theionarchaea archaeon]|nr:AAA family ATPase [Theionarchaea archaeon]MBU7001857.1 AAA family ATPase [Theionarchaea archaeon]MBU7022296.1 AAA family ATPase [Theionarchaea archaeon]MBU7035051.1 AAA family ATPase [Theionarchaea archaeon]MBU7040673.1 AAA family ATPase [Theionarchaea archaeon]
MNRIVVASTRENAGKTSFIVGLTKALRREVGYMKPFGDRLLYRKKRLWDYDSALMANIFGLREDPENITIAFEHSKIKYMYDEEGTKDKLLEMAASTGDGKELLIVEGGKDLTYGISVFLDAVSVARYLEGELLLVLSGSDETIVDDITFVRKCVDMKGVSLKGVVVTKVRDPREFTDLYLDSITELDVPVLGIIPYEKELTYLSVGYLSEFLFAKVLAGENGLTNIARHIFVGALSADAAMRNPLWKEEDKLIITGGDRTDMILAALESDTAGIILTNNVLPPSATVSKAATRNIPLLLVSSDTYQTAKQIDDLEPLLTREDVRKIDLLETLVKDHVKLGEIC